MAATPAIDLSKQGESGIRIKSEHNEDLSVDEAEGSTESRKSACLPELSQLQSRDVSITVANPSDDGNETSNEKTTVQTCSTAPTTEEKNEKPEPPPIDYSSICGAFGWTTIGSVHLPFIMRGEDRFVAVRMVECKIISSYADVLPWTVFTCTNIKSYYVTENEAKLLNEINGFHCEFQFGYQTFTAKDVVVRLKDTVKFYEFLETCKTKLCIAEGSSVFSDNCGFLIINFTSVPFVKKGTKKYVPMNMIFQEGCSAPVTTTETITEWDLAYLRFLSSLANIDQRKFKLDAQLCCIEDLQDVLGTVHFEEWWPNMQYSSKNDSSHLSSSNDVLPKWGDAFPVIQPSSPCMDSSQKLRDKFNAIPDKDSVLSSFLGLNKYLDMNGQAAKSNSVPRHHNKQSNSISCIQSHEKTQSLYSASLENLLTTSPPCNYPYTMNYHNQYSSHPPVQTSSVPDYDRCRKDETVPHLSSRAQTFPPPPPLVRLGSSRASDHGMVSKTALYPYLQTAASGPNCPPWLARLLEPEWFRDEESRAMMQSNDTPENLSRRLSGDDSWCATSLATSINMNGAGSSNLRNATAIRESYDLSHPSLCREDRAMHPHGGSPRLLAGPGPPPHYPTPPQSSPLQPLSLLDCSAITDLYATRSTPSGLVDLCSPPPSPDTRTSLSSSPRGTHHLSGYGYQPHVTRLVQVESRYVLAINIEPLKYNSLLAVPLSEVVDKFLRSVSVQSCQVVLETVIGKHLYECTSLQQDAFAKHSVSIAAGSKLVSLTDLKNCLFQLKFFLLERETQKERPCDIGATESPLSKRWCGNAREC